MFLKTHFNFGLVELVVKRNTKVAILMYHNCLIFLLKFNSKDRLDSQNEIIYKQFWSLVDVKQKSLKEGSNYIAVLSQHFYLLLFQIIFTFKMLQPVNNVVFRWFSMK